MLTEYMFLKYDLPLENIESMNMKSDIISWKTNKITNKKIINFKGEFIYSENRIFKVSFVIIFDDKTSNELKVLK